MFVGSWKSLIILKGIKETSGNSFPVLAKNQLTFEIFDKFLKITYKNLNAKLIFSLFSLPSSSMMLAKLYGWLDVGLGGGCCSGLGGHLAFGGSWFRRCCINPWI